MSIHIKLFILFLSLMCVFSCSGRWWELPEGSSDCDPTLNTALKESWEDVFRGENTRAYGCLQVTWTDLQTKSETQLVAITEKGNVYGKGEDGAFTISPTFKVPQNEGDKGRKFNLFVFSKTQSNRKVQEAICSTVMSDSSYNCLSPENRSSCWFSFSFFPKLKNGTSSAFSKKNDFCKLHVRMQEKGFVETTKEGESNRERRVIEEKNHAPDAGTFQEARDTQPQNCTVGQTKPCYPKNQIGCTFGPTGIPKCKGGCKGGVRACINGNWEPKCKGAIIPAIEVCDGKDNNCDGLIDNKVVRGPLCPKQQGACNGSRQNCVNGKWEACGERNYNDTALTYSQTELCDGRDNNCNGDVDESCCKSGETRSCVVANSSGHCRKGSQPCINRKWGICTGPKSSSEKCDGIDNDCDGSIDEGCSCRGGIRRFCTFSSALGECSKGTQLCSVRGEWVACVKSKPSPEICDGKDNNCNGLTDESLPHCVTTFAGAYRPSGLLDGLGNQALFAHPIGIAVDSKGNVYVADSYNHAIRKIDPLGNVTTFAGNGQRGMKNGLGSQARFNSPSGVAVDAQDNVYVADFFNNRICMINPQGDVTTLAGGTRGYKDAFGSQAQFFYPSAVAVDSKGNVYVADSNNHMIRKIDPQRNVTTLAGSGNKGFLDGEAVRAQFSLPSGVAVNAKGHVFVADLGNRRIREINPQRIVSTLAGTGVAGKKNGPGVQAEFYSPSGVEVDTFGNLYVACGNENTIRKIDPQGVVSTFAGGGVSAIQGGPASKAGFGGPKDVAVDTRGNVYVSDFQSNRIRKIDQHNHVWTLAGSSIPTHFGDGPARQSHFFYPLGLGFDPAGNMYVIEKFNYRFRKISAIENVTVFAGDGFSGFKNGTALKAQYDLIRGVVADKKGNVYVADKNNHSIRKIDSQKNMTTFAGNGKKGFKDGLSSQAQFNEPRGLAIDASGNLYVADSGNHRIRKIDVKGNVTTFAGNGKKGFKNDTSSQAQFNEPHGLAIDSKGNVYVADLGNHQIRKIDAKGNVTTFAGGAQAGFRDGPSFQALFRSPHDIVIDASGNLYVADTDNHRIRKIDFQGDVTTFAGDGQKGYKDGSPLQAQFNAPNGLAIDAKGNVYVADRENHLVRRISP